MERWRRRAVLGWRVPVAGAEREGDEPAHVVRAERGTAGQPDLDGLSGRLVGAREAGRNGGGVIRDQQVAGAEEPGEVVAGEALDGVVGDDGEEPRARARAERRPRHPERSEGGIPSVMPPSLRSG